MQITINTAELTEMDKKVLRMLGGDAVEVAAKPRNTLTYSSTDLAVPPATSPVETVVTPDLAESLGLVDNAPAPDTDSAGFPWDERIHTSTKTLNKDGTWRYKRGLDDETKNAVEAELADAQAEAELADAQAEAAPAAPVPPAAPAAPVPPAAPAAPVPPAAPAAPVPPAAPAAPVPPAAPAAPVPPAAPAVGTLIVRVSKAPADAKARVLAAMGVTELPELTPKILPADAADLRAALATVLDSEGL